MEEKKHRKFYVDWWNIRKSTIYMIVAVLFFVVAISAGGWWVSTRDWNVVDELTSGPKDAARIISYEGDVRITRAATRETILVTKETFIAAGDTIQTQADGRAVVQMIDGSVYTVRPNSTVVVRDSSSLFGGKNVRVSLDDGQINVRTDQQPENSENVVEVAESENKLLSQTDASFNADAQTSGGEIRISRGGVETTINGQKTTLTENEFAALNNGNMTREKLLEPPKQISPGVSAQIVDSTGSGVSMVFSWEDTGLAASSYYLQVSKSPYFGGDTVLVDRANISSREFRMGGLVPGTYYWRLKATSRSGQTTNWNDPWKFAVVRGGGGGQSMEARDWKVEPIGGNVFLIAGRTRPGAVIRSQGREVFAASDGSFRIQISTPASVTAIEIGDEKGNRSGFVLSLRNGTVARKY